MKRAWLLLAPLLLLNHGPLSAQDSPELGLSVSGVAGPELRARPRKFLAINVRLRNDSAQDAVGRLRVYRVQSPGRETPDQSLFYEEQVRIPKQGQPLKTLYYYCQENEPPDRLCVGFLPDSGPAPPAVFPAMKLLGPELQVLVISSRETSWERCARLFRQARVPAPYRTHEVVVARADLAGLPDHFAGYEPYDAVFLVDLAAEDLPPERARPLLDWVACGGDLIVASSGGRSELPPEIEEALPVERTDKSRRQRMTALRDLAPRHRASWPGDRDTTVAEMVRPRQGAWILAGSTDLPLVVRGRRGAGWVTYLAFPLDAAALRGGWAGTRVFAANLLRPPREDPESGEDIPPSPPLEEVLLNLSEGLETLEPPSTWIVAPLLLMYVALVGPLNYVLLKKWRRLGLATLTSAGVAVLFGLAFYGIGVLYKGSESLQTQVAVLELSGDPQEPRSRIDVMTGHFSTDRGLTTATAPPRALVGPLASRKATNRAGRVRRSDSGVELEGVTLDTWALRRFRSIRVGEVGHLQADLRLGEDGALSGTIANQTDLRLESPVLMLESRMAELDTLEPRSSLRIPGIVLDAPPEKNLPPQLPDFIDQLHDDARRRYPALYGKGLGITVGEDKPYFGRPRLRMLASFQRRLARVPRIPGKVPALLLAWAQHDPGGVVLSDPGKPVLLRTVVISEVQVSAVRGSVHQLERLSPVVADHSRHYYPTSGSTGTPPTLGGRGKNDPTWVVWRWTLPAPLVRLKSFVLHTRLTTIPDDDELVNRVLLRGWSFLRNEWVLLEDVVTGTRDEEDWASWSGKDRGTLIQELVDPASGAVFIRLSNAINDDLQLHHVALDVTFER